MKLYALSLGAGLLVGIIYSLLNVRSPAPPLVALVGLLGILVGEQVVPVGRQWLAGSAFTAACHKTSAVAHVFGQLPGRHHAPHPDRTTEEKQS
ncbi:XapX domain-containing protein [Pigmentiphaga sp. NML080357]|uniref:XapX domain-containing protein n=1 Tax=Pigmentiphaga sp. NML080357 TaxID=2008675 RepID=UPI000B41113A|nr:XapX domain-containing protein [Pigmentiphaga sp. NML080357]OVZ58298.1 XapX domain-containing protein [Pigmentiphaga sp. NML080357]